jgi:hypothetical protein
MSDELVFSKLLSPDYRFLLLNHGQTGCAVEAGIAAQ